MAFLPAFRLDSSVTPFELLPCSAITPKIGMALVLSEGRLTIATGETKPQFISMRSAAAAVTAGTPIPVLRVTEEQIFETTCSAAFTAVNIGSKVTLHATNGLQVTATTTNGVAEVISFDGTAAGSLVRVRF